MRHVQGAPFKRDWIESPCFGERHELAHLLQATEVRTLNGQVFQRQEWKRDSERAPEQPHDDQQSALGDGAEAKRGGFLDREELRARAVAIASFPASTRYLTPDVFKSSLVFGKARLESQHDEVNTLMRPILLDLYLHASWLAE